MYTRVDRECVRHPIYTSSYKKNFCYFLDILLDWTIRTEDNLIAMSTNRVCLRIKHLRANGYTDISDWLSRENNVYVGKQTVIKVKDKPVVKLANSPLHNRTGSSKEEYKDSILSDESLYGYTISLTDKTLGCFCDPGSDTCHADVLVEIINEYNRNIMKEYFGEEESETEETRGGGETEETRGDGGGETEETKYKETRQMDEEELYHKFYLEREQNRDNTRRHKTFVFSHQLAGVDTKITLSGVHASIMNNLYSRYPSADLYIMKKCALVILKALPQMTRFKLDRTKGDVFGISFKEGSVGLDIALEDAVAKCSRSELENGEKKKLDPSTRFRSI